MINKMARESKDKRYKKIIKLRKAGLSEIKIAEAMKIPKSTVAMILKKGGVYKNNKELAEFRKHEAVRLRQLGLTFPEIGLKIGITSTGARSAYKRGMREQDDTGVNG